MPRAAHLLSRRLLRSSFALLAAFALFASFAVNSLTASSTSLPAAASPRERLRLDTDWRFALGHATDPDRDFGHATGYFSYLAKTGFGDGPASPASADRAWRPLHVPPAWAAERPIDPRAPAPPA